MPRARKVLGVPMSKATLKDLQKAMYDIAAGEKVDAEEKARRLEVCGGCEHYNGSRCELCGCFMAWKAKLTSSDCPIGKWSVTQLPVDHTGEHEPNQ